VKAPPARKLTSFYGEKGSLYPKTSPSFMDLSSVGASAALTESDNTNATL